MSKLQVTCSMSTSNSHVVSVTLDENDFVDGELEGLTFQEKFAKMSAYGDLLIIKRFSDTTEWPIDFANQLARNAVVGMK